MTKGINDKVVEPNARSITSAVLFINDDGTWSVGPNTNALVRVKFAGMPIGDYSFGFSALVAEKVGDGYMLFVRSDEDEEVIVTVLLNAQGSVDLNSLKVLNDEEMYAFEEKYAVDLNDSGGFGPSSTAFDGGEISLYLSAKGNYQIGTSALDVKDITVFGLALNDKILPMGWQIVEVAAGEKNGFTVYLEDANGNVFEAQLNSQGAYTTGQFLSLELLAEEEKSLGVDINGNNNLPAAPGWTSVLKNTLIKNVLDSALAGNNGMMGHSQLVAFMQTIINSHKASGALLSSEEFSDLQAIASRGNNIFADDTKSPTSTDYLSFIFSKMVDGSVANQFYTGGTLKPSMLGNLTPNSPISLLEKLVDKWLLGGDMPSPTAGGDDATGKAVTTVGTYASATGKLFVDGIKPTDVKQGEVGDCFMVAALVAIANSNPKLIENMIISNPSINGERSFGVRFFDANGNANWVTVNDKLPVNESGRLLYGANSKADPTGELWVSLIEKAYAQANTLNILPRQEKSGLNTYWSIEGGFGDPLANITGKKVIAYSLSPISFGENPYLDIKVVSVNQLAQALTKALNQSDPIWIASFFDSSDSFDNILLTGGHAFVATDTNLNDPVNVTSDIWNPWGYRVLPTPPENVGHLSPFTVDLVGLANNDNLIFMIG